MLAQFRAYLPLGGLLPRPPPDGLPVWLGPLAGVAFRPQEECEEIMICLFRSWSVLEKEDSGSRNVLKFNWHIGASRKVWKLQGYLFADVIAAARFFTS